MIVGNDISSYQGVIDWAVYKDNSNFVVIKATEGNVFVDPRFLLDQTNARASLLPHGYYHFARPDLGNTASNEASAFLKTIGTLEEGEVLALDYEVNYHDPVNWCKEFLDAVYMKTGIKPFIYLNQSTVANYDWEPVVQGGYALWIAAYTYDPTNNTFQTGKFPQAAMQQWTDKQQVPGITGNVDGDCFFGDVEAFKKYGYHTDPCHEVKDQLAALQGQFDAYKASHPDIPVANTGIKVDQVPTTLDSSNRLVNQANQITQTVESSSFIPTSQKMSFIDKLIAILETKVW